MEQYKVEGMSCAACVAHVEKAVKAIDGVEEVNVSLLTNSMDVVGNVDSKVICKAVEDAGYHAKKKNETANVDESSIESDFVDTETPKMVKRLIWSVVFLIPLMYISMGHMMWDFPLPIFLSNNYVGMALTQLLFTIVIMAINRRFFISGWKSTTKGAPNMDTLVAMGSGVSFIYSLVITYVMTYEMANANPDAAMKHMHGLYFESAAMILTLITVGKTLESYSKGKTTNALKGLMDLAPKTANILVDGKETEVLATQVKVGDIFVVRPGESIPVDGVILEGDSAINESALTGESIPVDKTVKDEVSVGTINISGFLKCEATRVGEDTTLSKIVRMVYDASATKAPIAKIADKVAGIFTPVVLVIALMTAVVWLILGAEIGTALSHAITVLVISCPCALGLATPVAIMVGNGVGAKQGILYKNAVSLEAAGRADTVILDKTGTITKGEPRVTRVVTAPSVEESELLKTAYALECNSSHPLARAIVNYEKITADASLRAENDTEDFSEIPGKGVKAVISDKLCVAAKEDYAKECVKDASIIEKLRSQIGQDIDEGKTALYFVKDSDCLGVILVSDTIKEESPKAIEELKNMGMHVVMLTGDGERTANAIAKQAGVNEVIAGVLPDEKEKVVRRYKDAGKSVVMVGDGINDAPALTTADVGFAIGAGTDIAIDAADVVLINSKLTDVAAAIRLSRHVIRNIRENLFWAFIYNIIGIPLAAGVWIPITGWTLSPMFGAAAMSLSSFCVVMNALRLNLIDIYKGGSVKIYQNKERRKENGKMIIEVEGMMCHNCEKHVEKALGAIDGVVSVKASHESGEVSLDLDKEVDKQVLFDAISEEGYTPKGVK